MIISFKHSFVFFPIPKTGTHTLRNALRPLLHQLDWEQCILFEKKQFPVPTLANLQHGHISYQQLTPFLFPSVLAQYFKFCLVRNPLDRFISSCFFDNRTNQSMVQKPLEVMKSTLTTKKVFQHFLFQPQYQFVVNEADELMMDFVGKFEQMETAYQQICVEIGLKPTGLSHQNASNRSDDILGKMDLELKEMVYAFYQKDYELFGYEMREEFT